MQRNKIAGFDFDKMVVLIRTDKPSYRNRLGSMQQVFELQTITNDEMEVIKDAWLDYQYTRGRIRSK